MIGFTPLRVETVTAETAMGLARFAAREPLAYNDFASISLLMPEEPRVITAVAGDEVLAAAIDDGLAMSVAGEPHALRELSAAVEDLDAKLVVAGRTAEVEAFMERATPGRRLRPEHFMSVRRETMRTVAEAIPLRIAEESDLPLLAEVRAAALEEEYGITVDRTGDLCLELTRAVERAVQMQGVAIWTEHDRVAFTAQLIAKTPHASMFGDLYTDPDLRGEGRATRALTAFCVWLMSESEHITLRVGVDNTPAVRLYERVGFEVVDSFLSSLRPDQY